MRCFVTGCAGFIGSNLVDRLLQDGHEVIGYDNFSTSQPEFLAGAARSPMFTMVEGDTTDLDQMTSAMNGVECWQSAQVGQIRTREDYYYEELRGSSLRVLL